MSHQFARVGLTERSWARGTKERSQATITWDRALGYCCE
jgi:hypothetical protein